MLRDNLKSEEYFEKYIEFQKKRIEKFKDVLEKTDKKDELKIKQCSGYLANFYRDLCIAEYSYGESKAELRKTFAEYAKALRTAGAESYAEYVDSISLGILLECTEEIRWLAQNKAFDDGFVLGLKACLKWEVSPGQEAELKYPDYYKAFYDYLKDRMNLSDFCDYVENTWYPSSV